MSVVNESRVIAEAIQVIIQSMPEFDATSVYISNWDFEDETFDASPWYLQRQFGLVSSLEDSMDCTVNTWSGIGQIMIPFNDWKIDLPLIASLRDAINIRLNSDRNLGLTGYFNLNSIADVFPSEPVIELDDGTNTTDMPVFLMLPIEIEVITRE